MLSMLKNNNDQFRFATFFPSPSCPSPSLSFPPFLSSPLTGVHVSLTNSSHSPPPLSPPPPHPPSLPPSPPPFHSLHPSLTPLPLSLYQVIHLPPSEPCSSCCPLVARALAPDFPVSPLPTAPLCLCGAGLIGRNGTGKTTLLKHMAMHAIDGIPRNCQASALEACVLEATVIFCLDILFGQIDIRCTRPSCT